jgi:hypothetical protein
MRASFSWDAAVARSFCACERGAGFHAVAEARNDARDPARVGRIHRRRAIGIGGNFPFGQLFADESMQPDWFNREGLHLHRRGAEGPGRQGGRRGWTRAALAEQGIGRPKTQYDHQHQRNGDADREQLPLARPRAPANGLLAARRQLGFA